MPEQITNQTVAAHEAAHALVALLEGLDIERIHMRWDKQYDAGFDKVPTPQRQAGVADIAMAAAGTAGDGIRLGLQDASSRPQARKMFGDDWDAAEEWADCRWPGEYRLRRERITRVQSALLPVLTRPEFQRAIDAIATPLLAAAEALGTGKIASISGEEIRRILTQRPMGKMARVLGGVLKRLDEELDRL